METQQLHQLFLVLVIAFYINCTYHSQFASEVQLLPENNVSMHARFERICRLILPNHNFLK